MSQLPRALGKMNSSVQRVFRKTKEGFFLEFYLHFINFLNEDGSLRSSKLDRETTTGRLWRPARAGERSSYGEVDYKFPELPHPIRLICVSRG